MDLGNLGTPTCALRSITFLNKSFFWISFLSAIRISMHRDAFRMVFNEVLYHFFRVLAFSPKGKSALSSIFHAITDHKIPSLGWWFKWFERYHHPVGPVRVQKVPICPQRLLHIGLDFFQLRIYNAKPPFYGSVTMQVLLVFANFQCYHPFDRQILKESDYIKEPVLGNVHICH